MGSNINALRWILIPAFAILVSACDGRYFPGQPANDNIIGTKLEDMSSLNDEAGNDVNQVAIYDQTVSRIHQFNLDNMNVERSFPVLNPGIPHSVLYNLSGNFVIDFTTKNISIFDNAGRATHNPIRFVGTPVSAAFRPSMGLLVVYDSMMSVGMIKLDGTGRVLKAHKFGPEIFTNRTIAAGDIDDGGRLVLALSDGSVVKADIDASLAAGSWVMAGSSVATGLGDIVWLAPVKGQADQVLIATQTKLAIVDTAAGAVLGTPTALDGSVVWRSKGIDAHLMTSKYSESGVRIYYVSGGTVQSKRLARAGGWVTQSRLDIAKNYLTFVTANGVGKRNADGEYQPRDRMIRQWRFSDSDALLEEKVQDGTKLALASRSVFALVEGNAMGWALNYDLYSGEKPKERRSFNVPYIP